MVVVDASCLKQADSQPKSGGLVWGSAAAWRCSTFTRWTKWTLAMTWSWWQHYKYRRGYYYYYYYKAHNVNTKSWIWGTKAHYAWFHWRIQRATGPWLHPVCHWDLPPAGEEFYMGWLALVNLLYTSCKYTCRITKSLVTRCVFRSQNGKNALVTGVLPRPAGELTVLPQTP